MKLQLPTGTELGNTLENSDIVNLEPTVGIDIRHDSTRSERKVTSDTDDDKDNLKVCEAKVEEKDRDILERMLVRKSVK